MFLILIKLKDTLINQAISTGVLTKNQGDILKKVSKMHPHILAIANCNKWDAQYVEDRAINLLNRIWIITNSWLKETII